MLAQQQTLRIYCVPSVEKQNPSKLTARRISFFKRAATGGAGDNRPSYKDIAASRSASSSNSSNSSNSSKATARAGSQAAASSNNNDSSSNNSSEAVSKLTAVLKAVAVLLITAAIKLLEALLKKMGACLSVVNDQRVASLEAQVKQLQGQLAASGGGPAPVAAGGKAGGLNEVIFFPDPAMPCRHGRNCRRGSSCTYAHGPTSLTRLLEYIGAARRTFDICIFTLTCNEIAEAVAAAHKRGVRVRIITDDEQIKTTGSDIMELRGAGIPVRHDANVAHMHHKFAVIDGHILLNGSFNWTRQAVLQNQENVQITDNPAVVQRFAQQFEKLWGQYARNAV